MDIKAGNVLDLLTDIFGCKCFGKNQALKYNKLNNVNKIQMPGFTGKLNKISDVL